MRQMVQFFRLRKYTKILKQGYRLFKQKRQALTEEQKRLVQTTLEDLQIAILRKNLTQANQKSKQILSFSASLLRKSPLERGMNFIIALVVTFALAILIRQMWFEPYEIPTGSMRPTFKEQDRLVVSKTAFGINVPLTTGHLLFSPHLVRRNGTVVFTGENMDLPDTDTRYFYILPAKKQYVKRMIGKPGDCLYFYGGMIYGIDEKGNDISHELQLPQLEKIEHIPFLHFEGKVLTPSTPTHGIFTPAKLYQMNEPVAMLSLSASNQLTGEMLPMQDSSTLSSYSDLWGIKNFGMARLLSRSQALQFTNESLATLPVCDYYLEVLHHPSLNNLKIRKDIRGRSRPSLDLSSSVIPLQEEHLRTLFSNLYTVRFIVKDGRAHAYGLPKTLLQSPFLPTMPSIPDGTYEFYYGKAYKISFEGLSTELPADHPLCQFDPQKLQLLYNLGMEFDTRFSPQSKYTPFFPMRYVYFRNKTLYAMGAPFLSAQDPTLTRFIEKELAKQKASPSQYPYHPFLDEKPPLLADGTIDKEFVRQYGLKVPDKMYLVLGDNHAVSADSREFGFVPQENLRGAPDYIFWPFGNRFGSPNQPAYPLFNWPRAFIWIIAGASIAIAYYRHRKLYRLPLRFDFESRKNHFLKRGSKHK